MYLVYAYDHISQVKKYNDSRKLKFQIYKH